MDFLLLKRIADSAFERRAEEIRTYVYGYLVDEKSAEELVAGLNRIRSEEKARTIKEDEASIVMRQALEEKHSDSDTDGVPV